MPPDSTPEHVSGVEIIVEQAKNRVSESRALGKVSGHCKME